MKKYGLFLLIFILWGISGCATGSSRESTISSESFISGYAGVEEPGLEEELKTYEATEINFEGMAPDIARILERGQLMIALPATDTAIFHESDGQGGLMGFDIDLAKEIAAALGVEAVFDRSAETFSQLTDKLKNGEVDLVVSTYSMTPGRAMYVNFSDPYLETYIGVMIGKQQLVRNRIEQNPIEYMKANPIMIGAEAGTAHYELAQTLFPNAVVVPVENYAEGCEKVVSGELFALLSVEFAFLQLFESDPGISLYASVYTFTDLKDQFCVGVSRDTPQLLNFVNAYIRANKMPAREEVAKAFTQRYGGDGQ